MTIAIERATSGAALDAARALIRAHFEAHSAAHAPAEIAAVIAALPAPYDAPGGGLWLARLDGEPAGCAALQPLPAPHADAGEVKRMYVRPELRGRGVARALAERVIDEARAAGYARLRLGTLRTMHAAQALYASLGFRPIDAYRPVEFGDTLFYELALAAPADEAP